MTILDQLQNIQLSRELLTIISLTVFLLILLLKLLLLSRQAKSKGEKITRLQKENFELQTTLEQEKKYSEEKYNFLHSTRREMSDHFNNIAQTILEDKGGQLSLQQEERLSALLTPVQNQLNLFKTEINQLYLDGTKERSSLRQEIVHLKELNQQVNQETNNLTRALKGDKKLQGTWGELILEKVLEQSGLRNGHEFTTQKGFKDQQNSLFKPDVILHLPDNRDVIIDSKVSLVHWEKYVNCNDKRQKEAHLKAQYQAVKKHITTLSAKDYGNLTGLNSLDFVLLFIPIEAVFFTLTELDDKLITIALAHNIVLVTPTSLLTTVRTIENLWQQDRQEKSTREVAARAASLYDKFRGFTEDMEKLGSQLQTCSQSYEHAMNKLSQGKGNLISQSQQLTALGIRVKKKISPSILEKSELE